MSERTEYWRRMFAAWEASGLSQAEFCRQRDLKAVTFAWWKRRLRNGDDAGRTRIGRTRRLAGHGTFVELALPRGPAAGMAYELALPSGACLRLPADFDAERVVRLVHALVADGGAGPSAC